MSIPRAMLRRVVTAPAIEGYRTPGRLTAQDADRVLEIAYMAIAADGKLTHEELEAFRVVGAAVRELVGAAPAEALSDAELDALLERFAGARSRAETTERLRQVADAIADAGVRALAYKVSVALATADLAASDEEFEFEIDLVDALHLTHDVTERLTAEVYEALQADEDA